MLKILFQKDIQRKHIKKERIVAVLEENPAFRQVCRKLKLSVENVRSRIRIMIRDSEME